MSSQNLIIPEGGELAFIALGSNLSSDRGSPRETVQSAMLELQRFSHRPLLCSCLWLSDPVDCPAGSPEFVNAAVGIYLQPGETPTALLSKLQEMERVYGRKPAATVNAPRALDLDLISFGAHKVDSVQLTLPHPRAHSRAFVVFPLNQIAPELVLAGMQKSISELARDMADGGRHTVRLAPS